MELALRFQSLLASLYTSTTALATAALFFLLLSISLHWKQPKIILQRCFPSSLPFNYTSFCFDVLVTLPFLIISYRYIENLIQSNHIYLIPPLFYENTPVLITGFLAVFIGDLVGYFRHRLEHSRVLWPAHIMHHSDAAMTWFTLFRFHPINRLTTFFIDNSVLLILGFPLWALILNGSIRHYYGMFIHTDVPWSYGKWLGKVFVSPTMHRWHHVLEGQGIHSNYATVFSIFDQVFGTYYVPGPCKSTLGVKGFASNSPLAYFSQLNHPLKESFNYLGTLLQKRINFFKS